ncbi:MAG: type IV conjugative transfer system protein TraL [Pseudoruegeria sp.]
MNNNTDTITIEQKLEEPGRILIFTFDEIAAFIMPVSIGWLSRHLVPGFVVGLVAYSLWKYIKGEGGMTTILAAVYWFLPKELTPYRSFPDSAVTFWRG